MTEAMENNPGAGLKMNAVIPSEYSSRIILHIDMDSFYASVEMHKRPELRGKAVMIGADPKKGKGRGVVQPVRMRPGNIGFGQQCPSHRCSFSALMQYSFPRIFPCTQGFLRK